MTVNLSPNRLKQLSQIRRHNQALFADTQTSLARFPDMADSIITKAMRLLADELLARVEVEKTFASGPEYWITCPDCGQPVEEDIPCPTCNVEEQPPASQVPGADQPLYDLVIASRKYGYGETDNATDPILWWKKAGEPQQKPRGRMSLVDFTNQGELDDYELVDVEVHPTQIINKYRIMEGIPNER